MKRFAILLAATAFAACSSEPAEEAAETPAAEETTAASDMPGSYEITQADGTKLTATVLADGTYTDRDANGQVVEHGTWATTDGKECFTPAADSAGEPTCYTVSEPAEDGTMTATPDGGEPITVKKIA